MENLFISSPAADLQVGNMFWCFSMDFFKRDQDIRTSRLLISRWVGSYLIEPKLGGIWKRWGGAFMLGFEDFWQQVLRSCAHLHVGSSPAAEDFSVEKS